MKENKNTENTTIDKIDSAILNLQSLEAEFDLVMTQYKQAYLDYISSLQTQQGSLNSSGNVSNTFNIMQGRYWGTSGLKDITVNNIDECKAACAEDAKCTGATFNSSSGYCWLRTGTGIVSVSSNSNEFAIMPSVSQNVNNLKMLNDKLIDLNVKIMNELNSTEPTVLEEDDKKNIKTAQMQEANQKLLVERKNIYDLLDQYDDLNAQYYTNSIQVRQTNANYILWSTLAFIIIVFIIRFFFVPDSTMTDHIKFLVKLIIAVIFIISVTKINTPVGLAFFGIIFIILILRIIFKLNKKFLTSFNSRSGSSSGSGFGSGLGFGSNNNSSYGKNLF
jgi:hypothetical protein